MSVHNKGDYFLNNKENPSFIQVLKKSAFGFVSMSPMLLGVIGLVGIMQIYITPDMLSTAFEMECSSIH